MLGALKFNDAIKCTGVDRASNCFPLIVIGLGCFKRTRVSACSMAAENRFSRHSCNTSMTTLVNEYLPGSGAMASQLEALMISTRLLPFANCALAIPAEQSRRIRTSEAVRENRAWMADQLVIRWWLITL